MALRVRSFERALEGKRIMITGHTGFTGGWASLWLNQIGAEVAGYALPPATSPALFEAARISELVVSTLGDIRDADRLRQTIHDFKPEIILHLAAQPLVRHSYRDPFGTFEVNTLGTLAVLEAARCADSVKAVLCVTTDKVYRESVVPKRFTETDPLGAADPYSGSKAAAEIIVESYAYSFPFSEGAGPALATARGGNIIGGGDWSEDRIIPDLVRALVTGSNLKIRNPNATRPWQHVLALVEGYLRILAGLTSSTAINFCRPWNLGPSELVSYTVGDIVDIAGAQWEKPEVEITTSEVREVALLALDSSKAMELLGWISGWDTPTSIAKTVDWYRRFYAASEDARTITLRQIKDWRSRDL